MVEIASISLKLMKLACYEQKLNILFVVNSLFNAAKSCCMDSKNGSNSGQILKIFHPHRSSSSCIDILFPNKAPIKACCFFGQHLNTPLVRI